MQYQDMTKKEMQREYHRLCQRYNEYEQQGLQLDLSRGKPAPEQLALSQRMLGELNSRSVLDREDGTDCRNYGGLDGIPEAKALLAGMIIMLVFAAMDKEGNDQNSNEMLTQIFADKVARIRKYMPVLALMGGLIAAGTSMSIMAGDPISLGLLAEGDRVNAGLTALARAIGFIPLVATTAITTGVYAPAGMTFVIEIGLLIPNPFIALIAGAACICVEILLLNVIAKGLDKFPGIKRCGDNIRTAMCYVIDIALLIGGILAAQAIMPTTGLFIIVAFWCINKCSKKPLVSMAVGPLGAILVGLIANVLFLLSLYTPAA